MSYSSVSQGSHKNQEPTTAASVFSKLSIFATTAKTFAQAGASKAGSVVGGAVMATADTFGVKSQVEAAEKAARKAMYDGGKKLADANKQMKKARRLANRALDFEEDNGSLGTADYELLLSAAGASEKGVGVRSTFTQTFTVPAKSSFVWKARVKTGDIGFAVREIHEQGNSTDIEALTKFRSDLLIQGHIQPSASTRTIVLFFDNSFSHIQAKSIVYWVACGENVSLADDAVGAARNKEVEAAEHGPAE